MAYSFIKQPVNRTVALFYLAVAEGGAMTAFLLSTMLFGVILELAAIYISLQEIKKILEDKRGEE